MFMAASRNRQKSHGKSPSIQYPRGYLCSIKVRVIIWSKAKHIWPHLVTGDLAFAGLLQFPAILRRHLGPEPQRLTRNATDVGNAGFGPNVGVSFQALKDVFKQHESGLNEIKLPVLYVKDSFLCNPYSQSYDSAMSIQPFISRLKEAIEESPSSQGTIAEHIGVSRQSVTNWKTTGQISIDNLKKLSEVTGYRYVWLKQGTGPKRFDDSDQNDAEFHLEERVVREDRPETGYMGDEVSDLIKSIRYALANKKLTPDAVKALTHFFNTLVNSK